MDGKQTLTPLERLVCARLGVTEEAFLRARISQLEEKLGITPSSPAATGEKPPHRALNAGPHGRSGGGPR